MRTYVQKEGKSVGKIPFLKLDGGLDSPCIILKDFFVYFKYYIYLPQPQMVISLSPGAVLELSQGLAIPIVQLAPS